MYSCAKHVPFTYNDKIQIQEDAVAMGSPLGPLLLKIFMILLEEAILPTIKKHVADWKWYGDNKHACIDPSKIKYVLEKLTGLDT